MKIAYIGAGMFTNHCMFPQLKYHDIELAGICDLEEEKAQLAQQQFGFQKVYVDFRKMLEIEKPDAVFCVGRPHLVHYPVGQEVLKLGFPLYLQKPPAHTSREANELAELAEKMGVVCHVGFNLRSSPAVLKAKEIIGTEEFGQPLMGIFRYGLANCETQMESVIEQHCHLVDLTRFLMGDIKEFKLIKARDPKARDYVVAVEFESGSVGTLNFTSGQIPDKEFMYFEVTGNGTFLYSRECTRLVWKRPFKEAWWKNPEADLVYEHGSYGGEVLLESFGYIGDVANFLAAVRGEEEDRSPIQSAVKAVELCEKFLD